MDVIKRLPSIILSLFLSLIIGLVMLYVLVSVLASWISIPDLSPFWTWLLQGLQDIDNLFSLISPTIWLMIVVSLIFISFVAPKPAKMFIGALTGLLIILLLGISLYSFSEQKFGELDRGINHGDWSEPADYVRTVKNGTVTMRPGIVENFYVVGEVTLINPNPYTCLGVGPENTFWIVPARFASGEENPRRNVIRPKSGEKEMAFVRVKPASECSSNRS